MNVWGQLAVISIIALAAAGGTWWIKGPPARVLACDPATLKPDELCLDQIAAGTDVLWVDARPRSEWEKNGVEGSVLWNLDPAEDAQAFEAEVAVRVAVVSQVIVYCGDENCGVSRQVAGRIRALGMGAGVFVLHGGWRALSEAGRVRNSSPDP
ncbi:MAG: rhodanese-like domain-containing protein [Luteolibacter sp.]|jgi:rhodanese-related sulfurtransferase|nr:rhodanese-like domain-containing protein [Luteolibacter sp.]